MTDQATIIVSPAAEGYIHTADAVQIMADCGHKSWISPAGIQNQATLKARTICMRCVTPEQAMSENWRVTPEVYAALVTEIGQVEADHIIELTSDPKNRAELLGPIKRRPWK